MIKCVIRANNIISLKDGQRGAERNREYRVRMSAEKK
jgi:hypothetical protein